MHYVNRNVNVQREPNFKKICHIRIKILKVYIYINLIHGVLLQAAHGWKEEGRGGEWLCILLYGKFLLFGISSYIFLISSK